MAPQPGEPVISGFAEAGFSARSLAHWGLLETALKEQVRDRLLTAIDQPPPAVLEVLLRQWMEQRGLSTPVMVEEFQRRLGLAVEDLTAMVARPWRWQQWCEQQGGTQILSYFLARKAGLDQVRFWRLLCAEEELAAELYQRLRGGETGFERLAEQAGRDLPPAWRAELVGPVDLERLGGELAALLRVSEVGGLWAPRPAGEGSWQILQLEECIPAILDQPMRQRLMEELGEAALQQLLAVDQR